MASGLSLFTNQFNNITLVHSHEKCIYVCSDSLWSPKTVFFWLELLSLDCRCLFYKTVMCRHVDMSRHCKNCLYQVLTPVIGRHVDMLDTLQVYVVVQVHCCHGRHVDKGARLSELLVTMLNIALDGGKWS